MARSTHPPRRRSVRDVPRAACALLTLLMLVLCTGVPAPAAGDASDVVVDVVDAATGAPVALARVLLQGETGVIGYTDADGHARFESVATGAYRAMVVKRGFVAARSSLFDVALNRTSNVRVRMQRTGTLTKIGSVAVTSSPARASREVGQDDALRFLDSSLRDALGDLPGVTSSGDGLMVDGNDASQTGTSLDGVQIPGVGGSLADRGLNADLFGGASVSSGAQNGALGGNVGFRTLQPTRFPQQQATLQFGSDNSSSALVVARGSMRNLGYVLEHATRGRTSPFTGLDFTDQTALTYRHDGDRLLSGDLVKLRWAPSISQTLTLTATGTTGENGLVCGQLVALFPCGYGPAAVGHSRSGLVTLSENATIGATTVSIGAFANASRNTSDEPGRALAGVPAPQSDVLSANARGFNLGVQLPGGDRHDISLAAQSYGLAFDGSTTTTLGTFPIAQRTSYHGASVIDRYHPNARLTLIGRAGVNGSDGSTAFASGLDLRWQPTRNVAYGLTASAGDSGAGLVVSGTAFPDPRSLTFDCANGLAYGNLPSNNAARQRSSSLRASVERSGRRGRIALTAWNARLTGAPVLTAVDGTTLGLPPAYLAAVGAFASSPYVCGSPTIGSLAFTSYQPADQLNRGATLAGTLEAGKALFAGFVSVQSRFVTAATPATAALSPVGAQVPGTPLHRAGLVATAKLGRVVDVLANVSYTAANNPSRLPAYTVVNAGFATPLREGSLALIGTNLGNVHAGPFVSSAQAVALPRAGGPPLALPATPLAPRALNLTYTVRVGRVGATGSGAGNADASNAGGEGHVIEVHIQASPLREGDHPDALQIDPDNDACTPAAARIAQPVMDALGRISAAAEAAKTGGRYPATLPRGRQTVSGVALEYLSYDDGARYVVTIGGDLRLSAAFMNCARLGIANPDDREKYHPYIPAAGARGFFIAYTPRLGVYLVPPQVVERGAVGVRVSTDPEPAAAPADPYAQRPAPACPTASKPIADAIVAAVKAARNAQRSGASPPPPADVAQIVAHGAAPQGWLEIKPTDMLAQGAVIQCLHVAAVPIAHLQTAGIDDGRRPGAIGFSDRFGFYLTAPPPEPAAPPATPTPAP